MVEKINNKEADVDSVASFVQSSNSKSKQDLQQQLKLSLNNMNFGLEK